MRLESNRVVVGENRVLDEAKEQKWKYECEEVEVCICGLLKLRVGEGRQS